MIMKSLTQHITEKLVLNNNTKVRKFNYYPKTRDELKELVKKLIKERGEEANLNDIDTSEITDMSELFHNSDFNGDISKWDVSSVTDMSLMFSWSSFNGDISKWDVSNVKDISMMFYNCENFNKDISEWNLKSVQEFHSVFFNCLKLTKNHKPKFNK